MDKWINKIHTGNALTVLRQMPDELVDIVITSPPYFGLRNYGKDATTIWGGDKNCKHKWVKTDTKKQEPHGKTSKTKQRGLGFEVNSFTCDKCNAWKGQFGLEPNLDMYVKNSVEIYNEVKRVLKDTGSFYLNVGDTYSDKQLLNIPWKVAIALQEDDWILRSTIIWYKGNPLPTSVKDRLNNVYEPIFHFVKKPRYYYNLDSIRIPPKTPIKQSSSKVSMTYKKSKYKDSEHERQHRQGFSKDRPYKGDHPLGKNPGDVWKINTKSFPKAHFAVFPNRLIERPIKSSCPPGGIVLDPFCGTGTACRVAKSFGRKYIGIDINPTYVEEFAKEELGHGVVHEWV